MKTRLDLDIVFYDLEINVRCLPTNIDKFALLPVQC